MNTNRKQLNEQKGSILIIAVLFAAIAAISIGSYIRLAGGEMRLANAQFYSNASLNLAEAGIEEALYAFNQGDWSEKGWGQSDNANVRSNHFSDIALGEGAVGDIRVRVHDARFPNPTIYAQAEVLSGTGRMTVKQIEVTLRRRSLFANGITSRNNVKFSGGNVFVASYRSSDPDWTTLDGGSVASVSVEEDSVDVGNAEIFGTVATGQQWPKIRNGMVYGNDTPDGLDVDPNRVSTDFSSSFPEISSPEPENWHYFTKDGEETVLGDGDFPETTQYVKASDINLAGEDILRVEGSVVLIVDGDINVAGSAQFILEEGASLQVYVSGDMDVRGNGWINEGGVPSSLQVYGMGADEQSFSIGGGAQWHAAIYAPNAVMAMNGGGNSGEFRGAIVGKEVTMNGNSQFYYDEELRDLEGESDFAMASWRELHGNARWNF